MLNSELNAFHLSCIRFVNVTFINDNLATLSNNTQRKPLKS